MNAKFKIQLGRFTYIKTLDEVNEGVGNIPFINDQVKYVVNSLISMRAHKDKMADGSLPNRLSYCIPQLGNECPCTVTLMEPK